MPAGTGVCVVNTTSRDLVGQLRQTDALILRPKRAAPQSAVAFVEMQHPGEIQSTKRAQSADPAAAHQANT
jgi:hypothetical protein